MGPLVMEELKRIIEDSEIMGVSWILLFHVTKIFQEDDASWPEPDRVGRQELEILNGDEHVSFT